MKTFKTYLGEMARNIGVSYNPLNNEYHRKQWFKRSKNHPIYKHMENGLKIHQDHHKGTIEYHTNNHETGETLHRAVIDTHTPSKGKLPFTHITQSEVVRKSGNDLPKNHAKNITYNHFKNQKHPLVSSEEQYDDGHHMWKQLSHRALRDGYHVYHYDGSKLHETTPTNIDKHLKNSFGKSKEFEHKHMIISHHKL